MRLVCYMGKWQGMKNHLRFVYNVKNILFIVLFFESGCGMIYLW